MRLIPLFTRPATALVALLPCVLLAADPAIPATAIADEVVHLPKFEVVDTRLLPVPESWKYASIPGYEILTATSDRNTRLFVREFSRLQQVLTALWPSIRHEVPEVPVSIILCDRGDKFEDFIPPEHREQANAVNGLFYQRKESATIIVDFAVGELFTGAFSSSDFGIKDPVAGSSTEPAEFGDPQAQPTEARAGVERADPFRAFRLSYLRFLIDNGSNGRLPEWFKVGLLEILANIDYTRKTIEVGRVGDVSGAKSTDFNLALAERGLLPMPELFGPRPTEVRQGYTWTKQNYAFVHYCLYGEKRSHAAALVNYLERIEKTAPTEAIFKECFGMDYGEMELALRSYVRHTDHSYSEYKSQGGAVYQDPPKLELRDASDGEVGRIKGEALRLSGQAEVARRFIIAPYIRGERQPDLLAALGLAEHEAGEQVRARKFFEAAAKAGTRRARVYVLLAEMRANEALAKSGRKLLGREALDQVLPLLVKARSLPPLLPELYEVAADIWQSSDVRPSREEFNFVLQGALLFPARLPLVYRAALIAARTGYGHEARLLVEHGERYSTDPRGRQLFTRLRTDYPAIEQAQPAAGGAGTGTGTGLPVSTGQNRAAAGKGSQQAH